jgi:hypothetical protein
MKLKAIFSRKRICARCGEQIKQTHRWHQRHHRFLWFRWTTFEHLSCQHPHLSVYGIVQIRFEDNLARDVHHHGKVDAGSRIE